MGSNRRFCVRTPPGAPNGSGRITARQFLECSKNTPFPGSRQAILVIFLHFAIPIGSWFAVPSAHAHAPSPPTPTPFLRFLVWAGPVCCPALSRQNILREKKGGKKTILSQHSPDPLHVAGHQDSAASVVVTAAAERANRRHHPTSNTLDKSRPSTPLSASSQPSLSPTSYRPRNLPRFDGQVPAAWADAVASFTSKGVRGRSVVRPLPFRQRIPTALQPPLFASRSFPLSISPPSSPRPYVCYGYSLYDTLSPS